LDQITTTSVTDAQMIVLTMTVGQVATFENNCASDPCHAETTVRLVHDALLLLTELGFQGAA